MAEYGLQYRPRRPIPAETNARLAAPSGGLRYRPAQLPMGLSAGQAKPGAPSPWRGVAVGGLKGLGQALMAWGAGRPDLAGQAFSGGLQGFNEDQARREAQARDDELRAMQVEEYQSGKDEKAAAKAEAAAQKAARDAAIDMLPIDDDLKEALKTDVVKYGDVVKEPKAPTVTGGLQYNPDTKTWDKIPGWAEQQQASRPQTILNMPGNPTPDDMGRGEFAKQNAAAQAKYFDSVATAGAQAQQRMGDIDQLTKLIEMTPQGAGQEYLNKGTAVLSRFGVDLGEYANVPAAQAFQSIVSRVAPTLRVAGSGATSDFEMQQFLSSLPAIGNMPGGNRIIARNMKKISERSVQEAYIAAQVQGGDLTPAQGRKKILDLGPLNLDLPTFGGAPAGGPGGAPTIDGAPAFGGSSDDPLNLFSQ